MCPKARVGTRQERTANPIPNAQQFLEICCKCDEQAGNGLGFQHAAVLASTLTPAWLWLESLQIHWYVVGQQWQRDAITVIHISDTSECRSDPSSYLGQLWL